MRVVGGKPLTGGKINSFGDHRIAMSMAIAALGATKEIEIMDACNQLDKKQLCRNQ